MPTFDHPVGGTCVAVGHPGVGTGWERSRGGIGVGVGALSLLSRAETVVVSGPPAGVENMRGCCWVLFLLQQWHHSVESPCSLGRGKPAAAPAVTLGEDRRIPSCCCGMLGSRICYFKGGGGVMVAEDEEGRWGETLEVRGRRDALERGRGGARVALPLQDASARGAAR